MRRRDLVASCSAASLAAFCSRPKGGLKVIHVAAQLYLPMSPLFLADERGYFSAEGLTVQIHPLKGSSQAIPLLSSGQMDAAFYAISPAVVNAIARGARVRIVAARQLIMDDCGDYGRIVGSVQSFPKGFSSIDQLRGKTVAVSNPAGITAFCLDAYLDAAGMTRADISLKQLGHPQDAAALAYNQIDALISQGEETRITALGSKMVVGPPLSALLPNFAYSYIYFGKKFLDGDPSDGARFLKAFLRGAREFSSGATPKFLERYAAENQMDVEKARSACRQNTKLDGSYREADIDRFIAWCARWKHTETPVRAEAMVDPRFVRHAEAV